MTRTTIFFQLADTVFFTKSAFTNSNIKIARIKYDRDPITNNINKMNALTKKIPFLLD